MYGTSDCCCMQMPADDYSVFLFVFVSSILTQLHTILCVHLQNKYRRVGGGILHHHSLWGLLRVWKPSNMLARTDRHHANTHRETFCFRQIFALAAYTGSHFPGGTTALKCTHPCVHIFARSCAAMHPDTYTPTPSYMHALPYLLPVNVDALSFCWSTFTMVTLPIARRLCFRS